MSDEIKKPNAIQSLYGSGHAEARAGVGKRNQVVLTPDSILAAVSAAIGDIALDPCAESHDGHVDAKVRYTEDDDGLSLPWRPRTFCNPPYGDLKSWLAKALLEEEGGAWPMILLVPVRPHLRWWRAAARRADSICYLDPVKFKGFAASFPAPVCCMYFGDDSDKFLSSFIELGSSI